MTEREPFITSPLDLAQRYASEFVMDGTLDRFEHTEEEKRKLAQLDEFAHQAGTLEQSYLVRSGRSILLPVTFEASEAQSTYMFDQLRFKGDLVTHSVIRLRGLGGRSINAVCLTFDNVVLLPGFDTIPADQLLHVPALAVQDMENLAA